MIMPSHPNWRPTASIEILQARARILAKIRQFFAERQVLEVDTPMLSQKTVTDPYVIGIPASFQLPSGQKREVFLQTSPEYAMKRLLAAGSGPIYQLSKAFRQGDLGRFHQPEFTMLEWYRPGYDHHALMDEMDALLRVTMCTAPADRISYADLFENYLAINPHAISLNALQTCVQKNIVYNGELNDKTVCLDLLLTHCIEPLMGKDRPVFLYDFPVFQAALAKIQECSPPVASRFEVYFKGIELANGFHELQDAAEQRRRFENDLTYRCQHNLPTVELDEAFLAALQHGLPDCAGVALGVDRLIMLALGAKTIRDVISFSF